MLCCLSSSRPFAREFTKTSNTRLQSALLGLLLLQKNLLQFSQLHTAQGTNGTSHPFCPLGFIVGLFDIVCFTWWHIKQEVWPLAAKDAPLMTDHVTSTQCENLEKQGKVYFTQCKWTLKVFKNKYNLRP